MSQYTESGVKTLVASAAIGANLRVADNGSGKVELADASTLEIGVTSRPSFAADEDIPVRLRSAQGTVMMVAAGVVAAYAEVFAAAGGKCDDSGTVSLGHNMGGAATADGDIIEVLRS